MELNEPIICLDCEISSNRIEVGERLRVELSL